MEEALVLVAPTVTHVAEMAATALSESGHGFND